MPLSAGEQLGHYKILSMIGKGGMGEVYRATDTTLKRDVALKVLPADFSNNPERMARFQREAEVLASLDHPNIGQIHGIVESGGTRALALALIEGPTLADQIAAGPLPQEDVLAIAKQIIEALEYAHERGVVHRDLKPANIKINPEGVVKVLDFGLAKVLEDEPPAASLGNSPTLTIGHTRAGMILGTAAYMSPEQAIGRPVDRRSDIFSFGAVLFEMLTGQSAFAGTTTPDVLEAVVKSDPDWTKLPAGLPGAVERLLRRCLVKDRKRRLQAIGEGRILLEGGDGGAENSAQAGSRPFRSRLQQMRVSIAWAVVVAVIAGVALWGWLRPEVSAPRPIMRFAMTLPASPNPGWIAFSPDGSRLAFGANQAGKPMHVRALDQLEMRPLAGTEDAYFPAFSPDGEWIAYMAAGAVGRQLKKIPVAGGAPLTLVEGLAGGPSTISWERDDYIYFGSAQDLERVPSSGGKPQILVTADPKKSELAYAAPQLLPGGKQLLFDIALGLNKIQAAVLNLKTGEKQIVLEDTGYSRYAPAGPGGEQGHIVFARNGTLFAAPFDTSRLKVGSPVPVLEGIAGAGVFFAFGFSDSGTLAYIPASSPLGIFNLATLVWVDRQGMEQPLAAGIRMFAGDPRLSPDGGRAAISILDPKPLIADVWAYDLARGSLARLTSEKHNLNPVWTPDAKRLFFASTTSFARQSIAELRSVPADSSGPSSAILPSEGDTRMPTSVSPDGKLVMGIRNRPGGAAGSQIWVLPEGGKLQVFLDSPFTVAEAAFSPDGRWVAFQSNDTGRSEVYVVPYPGPGGKTQVSTGGGTAPRWAGRELFYRSGARMMVVEAETGASFRAGLPKLLFEKTGAGYDVSPDGKRFLMVKPGGGLETQTTEMRLVVNWREELWRRVPPGK